MAAEGAVKRIALLGSTGSIGASTLEVVSACPGRWQVVTLAACRNHARMVEQALKFRPQAVAMADPEAAARVEEALRGTPIRVMTGRDGIIEAATWPAADWVVAAMVGIAGLVPTYAAIQAGKHVALANKECLVTAGALIMAEVARQGTRLIPVDSEHSAIFQVLNDRQPVTRLILTASGGPFRGWSREALAAVTKGEALAHPNWAMGAKVTIDSATLMNKGLEVIEAAFLFGMDADRIEVVVHPESIVHSLVEYPDGSVLAQMGMPDMRTPIAVALAWPDRVAVPVPRLDLASIGRLTFQAPDREAFPCLDLAYAALRRGGGAPVVLNAANEVAVAAFLAGTLRFVAIPELIARALAEIEAPGPLTLTEVLALDALTRQTVAGWRSV